MIEHHPGWLLIAKLGIILPFGAVIAASIIQIFNESRELDFPIPGFRLVKKKNGVERMVDCLDDDKI
jgi:hypothetical protein